MDEALGLPAAAYPTSVDEALALLAEHGEDAKILAGGQSLLVLLRLGLVSPSMLINLKRIPKLELIGGKVDGGVAIGSMATQLRVSHDPLIRQRYQALSEAAAVVASPAVRRLGTIGGNLCHADPTGDPPAALIALGAEVEIASAQGTRTVPVETLFADYMETSLAHDELLVSIKLPQVSERFGSAYLKHRMRGIDTALVGVGIGLELADDASTCSQVRIGLAGAAVTPLRAVEAENDLRGAVVRSPSIRDAAETAANESAPLDDTEGSEWYRREMVKVFVERALGTALARAQGAAVSQSSSNE